MLLLEGNNMTVIKVGDFVVLENDVHFIVAATTEYEGENYLYGFKAPDKLGDAFSSQNLDIAFLREIVEEETQECFVEEVEDEELVKVLTNKIAEENGLIK